MTSTEMRTREAGTEKRGNQTGSDQRLKAVADKVRACMQCGTCTASCPNAFAMDLTPRQMWRLVMLGRRKRLFESRTFMLCSACYSCSLRCPRGLPLTEAMALLKQIAAEENPRPHRRSLYFYREFLNSIRRHGRVRETSLMTSYFAAMKNPLLPLQYSGLGLRLMARGKMELHLPMPGKGRLDRLFEKTAEVEKSSNFTL